MWMRISDSGFTDSVARQSSLGRTSTARNEAINVRMVSEHLTPCAKSGHKADLAATVSRIGRIGFERCGDAVNQDGLDDRLIVEGSHRDFGRHRKHKVEIRRREQIDLTVGKPPIARCALTLGTMPIADSVERQWECVQSSKASTCPPSAAVQ